MCSTPSLLSAELNGEFEFTEAFFRVKALSKYRNLLCRFFSRFAPRMRRCCRRFYIRIWKSLVRACMRVCMYVCMPMRPSIVGVWRFVSGHWKAGHNVWSVHLFGCVQHSGRPPIPSWWFVFSAALSSAGHGKDSTRQWCNSCVLFQTDPSANWWWAFLADRRLPSGSRSCSDYGRRSFQVPTSLG